MSTLPFRWLNIIAPVRASVLVNRSIMFVSLMVLPACIAINDVEQYWEKAKLDPALQGDWKEMGGIEQSQNRYLTFRKDDEIYRVKNRRVEELDSKQFFPDDRSKSIKIGNHSFLIYKSMLTALDKITKNRISDGKPPSEEEMNENNMLAEESDKSGFLIKYHIDGDRLTFFHIKEEVIAAAIDNKEIKGTFQKTNLPNKFEVNDPNIDKKVPVIDTLDESTIKFLTRIAGDSDFWKDKKTVYRKIESASEDIKKSLQYPVSKVTDSNREVMVDLPELSYFAKTNVNLLLRHLRASPEWKVFYDRDELVAYRRVKTESDWLVELNGFHGCSDCVDKRNRWQIRHMFRFSEKRGGAFANKHNRSKTTFATPTAGKIKLKLKSSDQGIESYLVIGKEDLYYEFFEQRSTTQFPSKGFSNEQRNELEKRIYTRLALKWVKSFLETIKSADDEINRIGFCKKLMPKDGVKEGKPTIEIEDLMHDGFYNVSAWVNPGVKGKVYFKVINIKTGESVSEDRVTLQSTEYMGWSAKAETLFRYNANFIVYEENADSFYDARFEMWVQPSDGSKEKKLLETTHKINSWQRR